MPNIVACICKGSVTIMGDRKLVGLVGHIGSGKSTVAQRLTTTHGYKEYSFAQPLKKACQALFSFTDDQVYGDYKIKETPDHRWFNVSPRQVLQFVGTDLLREQMDRLMPGIGKDIFIHAFINAYQGMTTNVVISDVRFDNEVKAIKDLGGIIIKIERDGIQKHSDHTSEALVDVIEPDYVLANDGTLEELHAKIDALIEIL
jgi:hypothetical protein